MKRLFVPAVFVLIVISTIFFVKQIMAQGRGNGNSNGGGNENSVGNENNEGNESGAVCASISCEQPCTGISCGCHNTGSAYDQDSKTFKTCDDPSLSIELVPCVGADAAGSLCDEYSGQPQIYKCVNPNCPNSNTCGCNAQEGEEPTVGPGPATQAVGPGACWSTCTQGGTDCTEGKCVNVNGEYRCSTNSSQCTDPAAAVQGCHCPCSCSEAIAQGMTFSCPQSTAEQPGKAEGPIEIGGTIPSCFACDSLKDGNGNEIACDTLPVSVPTPIRYDELDGNTCKTFNSTLKGYTQDVCSCNSSICCPKCTPPEEVQGVGSSCGSNCDFSIEGPNGAACPCTGSSCNTFQRIGGPLGPENGYGWDFGEWNDDPDVNLGTSCLKTKNAGVKQVTLQCPGNRKCVKEIVFACKCSGSPDGPPLDVTLTPAWYKLRDDQFHKFSDINNPIPPNVNAFDDDDIRATPDPACDGNSPDDIRCFNLNQAGIVSAQGDTIDLNGAPISYRQWHRLNYTKSNLFTPQTFLDYAKARKPIVTITDINDLDDIRSDSINVLTTSLTIDDATELGGLTAKQILEDDTKIPYVLIVQGNVTIDTNFNEPLIVTDSPKALAIISTGQVNIAHGVTYIGGIIVGNSLDFAYDKPSGHSEWPLKFKGNIISYTNADTSKRKRNDDPLKPSIFVVFDPKVYAEIIDLLSVRTYDWRELVGQ